MQRNGIRIGIRSNAPNAVTRLRGHVSNENFGYTFRYAPVPAVIILLLWLTGAKTVTWPEVFLSLLLLQIAWSAWVSWKFKPGKNKDFPVFASIAAMFWMAYGLPLYWSRAQSWRFSGGYVTQHGVVRAQALALLGIAAIYIGMQLGFGKRLRTARTLQVRDAGTSVKYLVFLLALGAVLRLRPEAVFVLGASLRQVMIILFTVVPMVAYAILLRRSLMRPVPLYERALLVLYVAGTFLVGLSTGWVGTGASIIVVTGCVLIDARQKIPKLALIGVFAYILFLQPAKEQFRGMYWYGASDSTNVSRAVDWISMSQRIWQSELSSSDGDGLRQHIYGVISRFSLLQQTANVLDMTPELVPYQGWKMYSYMATALIPRAIWQDKPTINQANRLYQVVYGITPERALDGVSISVGVLTESYISFGWFGALVVMTLLGVVLDCFGSAMLSCNSGSLSKGIGFALLPGFVVLESQMAQYLGGIVQSVGLSIAVLLPVAQVIGGRLVVPRLRPGAVRKPPIMHIRRTNTRPVIVTK